MNAHVNANCNSCGLCVSTCPSDFYITEAANACPVDAIEVR